MTIGARTPTRADHDRGRLSLLDLGSRVLDVVDQAVEHRWEAALQRAAATADRDHRSRVSEVTRSIRRELVATGAASGGAAAFPGAGTAVTIASLGGDLAFTTIRLTDLVLTIGAIHGHRDATVEERRLWVLAVLAFGDDAPVAVRKILPELGKGLGARSTARISIEVLRRTNKSLARTVISRYGRKRAVLGFGKLLPFGFGAAIGAGGNAMLVRAVARSADAFMSDLPFDR